MVDPGFNMLMLLMISVLIGIVVSSIVHLLAPTIGGPARSAIFAFSSLLALGFFLQRYFRGFFKGRQKDPQKGRSDHGSSSGSSPVK